MKGRIFLRAVIQKNMNLLNGTILFQIIYTAFVFFPLLTPFWNHFINSFFALSVSPDSEEQPGFHEPADPAPGEGHWELPQKPGWTWQVCGEDEHILWHSPTGDLSILILCSGFAALQDRFKVSFHEFLLGQRKSMAGCGECKQAENWKHQ